MMFAVSSVAGVSAEDLHKPRGVKRLTVLLKAARRAAQLSLACTVSVLASTSVSASPVTTDTTVSYLLYGLTLTITSTSPTTLNLAPGESYTLSGTWSASGRDNCSSCVVQAYLAGLSGLDEQIDLALNVNFPNYVPYSTQGSYAQSFTAPTVAGTYYFGAMTAANFGYVPVDGAANSLGQVSYIVNVADATVPEPTTLALVGAALLVATAPMRRRAVK